MTKSHVSALLAKHHDLEARLEAESVRPAPDERLVAELKKQKLRLKDALAAG